MITARRTHRKVPHVYSGDPALDKSNGFEGHWKKFLETGDVAELPLRDGQKPTVFYLSSLKREHTLELGDITDPATLLRRHDAMVSFGLVDVANLVDQDGRPMTVEFEDWRGSKRVSASFMNDVFHIGLVLELGARIWELSHAGPL